MRTRMYPYFFVNNTRFTGLEMGDRSVKNAKNTFLPLSPASQFRQTINLRSQNKLTKSAAASCGHPNFPTYPVAHCHRITCRIFLSTLQFRFFKNFQNKVKKCLTPPIKILKFSSSPAAYQRLTYKERPHRLAWSRTPASHAGDRGSNPLGDAKIKKGIRTLILPFFYC